MFTIVVAQKQLQPLFQFRYTDYYQIFWKQSFLCIEYHTLNLRRYNLSLNLLRNIRINVLCWIWRTAQRLQSSIAKFLCRERIFIFRDLDCPAKVWYFSSWGLCPRLDSQIEENIDSLKTKNKLRALITEWADAQMQHRYFFSAAQAFWSPNKRSEVKNDLNEAALKWLLQIFQEFHWK